MQNFKYAVETKIYDNGKVTMTQPFKVDFASESKHEEKDKYDYYLDVFSTLKEAREFTMMDVQL
jgi:ArsR family metal-binding transcriptional regulator